LKHPKWQVWLLRVAGVVSLIAAWWYATGPGGTSRLILPPLDEVIASLIDELGSGALYINTLFTLGEIVAAFFLAATLGVLAGLICARGELRARIWEPLLIWGYLAPSVLFFPLFILWFGAAAPSKILFGAASAFFPIAYNTLRGLRTVDPTYLKLGKAFNASHMQSDFIIKLPAALPLITVGLRIGAATTLITVVLGEMLAATQGIAFELARSSQMYNSARTYALMLVILVLVVILQKIVQALLKPRWESSR
jgi:ABC-type nitrate/sulfonate/bicarbonate transport system permease component